MEDDKLLAEKEEGLLFVLVVDLWDKDRAAQIVTKDVLLVRENRGAEVGLGVKVVVAEKLPRGAMELVGAALGLQQDHRRAHEAVLGAVVVLQHAHFFQRVRVRDHGLLVHVAGVLVPNAIERVEGLALRQPIDRKSVVGGTASGGQCGTCGGILHARHQRRQPLVVASVHGQRGNLRRIDAGRVFYGRRLHLYCIGRDLHRCGGVADLQRPVYRCGHRRMQLDPAYAVGLEADLRDTHTIAAYRQPWHNITSVRVGGGWR